MPIFPSTEWMQVYADTVLAHDQAPLITSSLVGRYRFVVKAEDDRAATVAHDLVVAPGLVQTTEVTADTADPDVTITAGYDRWKSLLTGQSDVLLALLMRRIRVEGDLGRLRRNAAAAGPLLACLNTVPTTFSR